MNSHALGGFVAVHAPRILRPCDRSTGGTNCTCTAHCDNAILQIIGNVLDAGELYWILKNTGGMDDADLAQFLQRMKTARAAVVDGSDGVAAEAHTVTVPTEARKTMLEILRKNIYEDAQMLDVQNLSARETTATEIQAAYQAQDSRAADLEYNLIEFIQQICDIAGIPNSEPVFVWNKVINQKEQTEMVLMAAQYLDEEAILNKLPWLTPEEAEEILKRKSAEEIDRRYEEENPEEDQTEDVIDNAES